jgi:hypothetical protein
MIFIWVMAQSGYPLPFSTGPMMIQADPSRRRKATLRRGRSLNQITIGPRRFQLEWQAHLPWAEGVLSEDGKLHMVRCRTCTTVDGQEKLLAPKLDTLLKHEGRRRATDCRLCRAKKKRWSLCLSKKVIGRRLIFCEFMH